MSKATPPADLVYADAARVMQAAGAQIDLALEESHPAVEQLGDTLVRLSAALADLGQAGGADVAALREDLARAITCLQFHDRMTQHLSHVCSYLQDSAGEMAEHLTDADPLWEHLHRRLSARLLTDAHREHLERSFPRGYFEGGAGARREPSAAGSHGEVELF